MCPRTLIFLETRKAGTGIWGGEETAWNGGGKISEIFLELVKMLVVPFEDLALDGGCCFPVFTHYINVSSEAAVMR